jgi:hypothetical protein
VQRGSAAVEGTKALLDWASLPPDEEFGPGLAAFFRTSDRPENAAPVMYLFELLTVAYRIHCVDGGAQISQPVCGPRAPRVLGTAYRCPVSRSGRDDGQAYE